MTGVPFDFFTNIYNVINIGNLYRGFMKRILSLLIVSFSVMQSLAVSSVFNEVKDQVAVKVEKLDPQDCKKLFNGESPINGKDPIYPIRVAFHNESDRAWGFNTEGVNLNLATEKELISKINKKGIINFLGTGLCLGGVLIFGLCALSVPYIVWLSCEIGYLSSGIVASSAFWFLFDVGAACGLYKGAKLLKNENAVSVNYDKSIFVTKGETEIMLFVKKSELKESFKITLFNAANSDEKITFDVKLA